MVVREREGSIMLYMFFLNRLHCTDGMCAYILFPKKCIQN